MSDPHAAIELRVERIANLFDPFDPFPLPSRDLSGGAEAFIVDWARELPREARLRIVVHAPRMEADSEAAGALPAAVKQHFGMRAQRLLGDLHELFRVGRASLFIGLAVLALCVGASALVTTMFGETPLTRFVAEGLFILGWVANWRPLEIILYDWWPLVRRRRLMLRLAAAPVEVRTAE